MTAPNAALAQRVINEIRQKLIGFDWSNYGLDLMEDAQPDWADDLAERIFVEVAEHFGPRPNGGICPDPDCRHAGSLHQAHGCVGHHGLCRCAWRPDGGEGGSVTGGAS